jgi:hypothetical protein
MSDTELVDFINKLYSLDKILMQGIDVKNKPTTFRYHNFEVKPVITNNILTEIKIDLCHEVKINDSFQDFIAQILIFINTLDNYSLIDQSGRVLFNSYILHINKRVVWKYEEFKALFEENDNKIIVIDHKYKDKKEIGYYYYWNNVGFKTVRMKYKKNFVVNDIIDIMNICCNDLYKN